jgi:hypothetical protein
LYDDGDYVHTDEEEAVAIEANHIITEAAVAWSREEADVVRQVRAFEAAQKEAVVKRELVVLDDE